MTNPAPRRSRGPAREAQAPTSLYLTPDAVAALRALAERLGVSRGEAVARAVRAYGATLSEADDKDLMLELAKRLAR